MNHLKRFERQLYIASLVAITVPGFLTVVVYASLTEFTSLPLEITLGVSIVLFASLTLLSQLFFMPLAMRLPKLLWQAVWHVSPGVSEMPAPKIDELRFGRELVSALVKQVYELASSQPTISVKEGAQPVPNGPSIIDQLPMPVFVLNKERTIVVANTAATQFLGMVQNQVVNKNVYDVLRMSFSTESTFDAWLSEASTKRATDTSTWEHVRITREDKSIRQFDLAAAYSKDAADGNEVMLTIFDRTESYNRNDQASSYVALAVHELRTPLTVLRGYIEVFEDELGETLTPEHQEFMRKMSAAAQSLTAFVSNILNVARVDENQMTLSLHEANWNDVLPKIVSDLELRASVRGKKLELDIQPSLPSVAIDRISMYEVVSNLVDNAIKYSASAHRIVVRSYLAKDGSIATEVEDFGPGMPESAMSDLFTKFYRSHRSKNSVGGSGLGLYLVKSIVTAHGGNVWVNSHEGQGSKFGFSLQAFANVKPEQKNGQDGIERQAGGWIKNHSMYRR